jgi:hypothetical protein
MWRALDAASVRMTKSLCSAALCWPFLAYELDNLRNQFGGHNHDGLPLGQKSRFVFGNLLVFGLVVIALRKFADTLFIPSGGVRLFLILRVLRSALSRRQ